MKIRLLIDAKMPGGIESHVMNLCAGLIANHHDCTIVFVTSYENNPLYAVCKERNLPFVAFKNKRLLFQYFRSERPDIIHTHGYKANILGRLYFLFSKKKTVATFHAGEPAKGRMIFYTFIDRWSSFLSCNIAVNDHIAKTLPTKATVISNFVDVPNKPNTLRTKGPFHIYFIGRFNVEKDPLLFCALSSITGPDFEWHMAGNGPLLAECREHYKTNILFHGLVTDMEALWPDVDMLCITSRHEGLPLVLLEAMARGVPVVSFDVGNIKSVITNKNACIDTRDIQLMANYIQAYFAQPLDLRLNLSVNERQKIIDEFSIQVITPKIEAVYQDSLTKPGTSHD